MISVIILAKNEAANLAELLPQLSWADQVMVLDDGSTDATQATAIRHQARWVPYHLNGDYAAMRNFGLSLVKSGWVLFLDADERLSDEAVREIQQITRISTESREGYQLQRIDIFYGKALHFGETGKVWLTRLALVGAGVWQGRVHETWEIAATKRLSGKIYHQSHESVKQLFSVVSVYARIRAGELHRGGVRWSVWEQLTYPAAKFCWTFFGQWGILDGWRGLVMSAAMSWHSWLVRWYQWETPWLKRPLIERLFQYVVLVPWILLPFGQLTRIELPVGGAVYLFEAWMGVAVVYGIGLMVLSKNRWILPPWFMPGLGFIAVLLVSWAISPFAGQGWLPLLYWGRLVLYGGYLVVMRHILQQRAMTISITGLVRYSGYLLLGLGVVQMVIFPDTRSLYWLGWDDHYYRMVGTLFDPNFFGLMALLVGWWAIHNEKGKLKMAALALAGIGLVASFSRTAYVLAAAAAGIYVLGNKRAKKQVMVVLIAAVLLYLALPKPGGEGVNLWRWYSVVSRAVSWQQAVIWIQKYPIWGIGYNYYPIVQQPTNLSGIPYHPSAPDNSWLYVMVTGGIVGMAFFVTLVWSWWRGLKAPWLQAMGGLIALHALTNNTLFYPWVMMWWWLMLLQSEELKLKKPTLKN